MTDIKYDWNIPIPKSSHTKRPTSRMGMVRNIPVGASLLFPATREEVKKLQTVICGASGLLTRREPHKPKYVSRRVEGGIRVWRIS